MKEQARFSERLMSEWGNRLMQDLFILAGGFT